MPKWIHVRGWISSKSTPMCKPPMTIWVVVNPMTRCAPHFWTCVTWPHRRGVWITFGNWDSPGGNQKVKTKRCDMRKRTCSIEWSSCLAHVFFGIFSRFFSENHSDISTSLDSLIEKKWFLISTHFAHLFSKQLNPNDPSRGSAGGSDERRWKCWNRLGQCWKWVWFTIQFMAIW